LFVHARFDESEKGCGEQLKGNALANNQREGGHSVDSTVAVVELGDPVRQEMKDEEKIADYKRGIDDEFDEERLEPALKFPVHICMDLVVSMAA
jgi:hypothetical protein